MCGTFTNAEFVQSGLWVVAGASSVGCAETLSEGILVVGLDSPPRTETRPGRILPLDVGTLHLSFVLEAENPC